MTSRGGIRQLEFKLFGVGLKGLLIFLPCGRQPAHDIQGEIGSREKMKEHPGGKAKASRRTQGETPIFHSTSSIAYVRRLQHAKEYPQRRNAISGPSFGEPAAAAERRRTLYSPEHFAHVQCHVDGRWCNRCDVKEWSASMETSSRTNHHTSVPNLSTEEITQTTNLHQYDTIVVVLHADDIRGKSLCVSRSTTRGYSSIPAGGHAI